jgi:hypothetical protein
MNIRRTHTVFVIIKRFPAFLAVLLLLTAISPGCRSDQPALGKAALTLQDDLQATLDLFSAGLAEPMSIGDKIRVKAAMEKLSSKADAPAKIPISIAVLNNHGATVATAARSELSATQNYGNYHAVSRVVQKRKVIQSSLYLQGGEQIFIVCAPLLYRQNLVGILIIGIDDDLLHQAGITDAEFMSLPLSPHPGTPR